MRNSYNRGSAPDRARDALDRPGSFKAGHAKLGGRKKGTPNAISPALKRALLKAAHRVGSDGNGKDGAVGYFGWLMTREPDVVFKDLLMRMLTLEQYQDALGQTIDERDEAVRPIDSRETTTTGRSGARKKPKRFDWLRGGPNAYDSLVQDLMRLAVERPKAFGKMFGAACLALPTNWRSKVSARTRRPGF